MRLLLVEDEPGIAVPLERALRSKGYSVRHAGTLEAARAALEDEEPDLILLDIQLPDHPDGGFVLAREARAFGYTGRILFMTARDASEDRVRGLDDGGDDYVVKPFDLPEVFARIRALLRRDTAATAAVFKRSSLSLDFTSRNARWNEIDVNLTAREFALLERLALAPDRVFSSEDLIDAVWGGEGAAPGAVKVFVYQLRQKLAASAIETVSRGYRLGPCDDGSILQTGKSE
jgi:two-component system, OmpR family, response regulator QseB